MSLKLWQTNKLTFSERAGKEYLYRQKEDKKILKRINELLKNTDRNGSDGIGKPESPKSCDGYRSRSIDERNRLVYKVYTDYSTQRRL